ncbi:MAG TPA: molybdopterin molybdenumtransferase MoeA, partial [Gammaproteobacteria bacterium]|nr:molybdopterin molybdenumtransferase MoeA [Gammaproteobacteria bacterium]
MTDVADAEALILDRMPRLPTRAVALESAAGCVLREAVRAERDQPPFDRVTMDGIAIAFRDWRAGTREFDAVGVQAAGARPLPIDGPGQCVEVMTGAMLPPGADTIIPVERIARDGE